MARSVVDLAQITEFRAAINANYKSTNGVVAAFNEQTLSLLSQFEAKLAALESVRDQKYAALSRCELRQAHDEKVSCAAEERAHQEACEKCRRCKELVDEAHAAIQEFEGHANNYRQTMSDLASRADAGLARIEAIVQEYLGSSSGQQAISAQPQSSLSKQNAQNATIIEQPEMRSSILISGTDQIAFVHSKGSGRTPVFIDEEAMASKFDKLPSISGIDPNVLHQAAIGIPVVLAAGGVLFFSKDLVRQNADKIFEDKYGISTTELYIGTGNPKQEEYVKARNQIEQDLQKELFSDEIQSRKDFITSEEQRKKEFGETLHCIELTREKKIELLNLENQLATLGDGKERPVIPVGKTKIGGLSEDGLSFMMGKTTTKERFMTISNILGTSDVTLTGDSGNAYVFSKGDTDIYFVAHDGSSIDHFVRDASEGMSFNAPAIDVTPNVEYSSSINRPSEITSGVEIQGQIVGGSFKNEGFRVTRKYYSISPDGSANAWGTEVSLGIEASANLNVSLSNLNIEGEASLAKAGAKYSHLTAPSVMNGQISQFEVGASGSVNLAASVSIGVLKSEDGTREVGIKLPGGKIAAVYDRPHVALDEFPQTIREEISKTLPKRNDIFDSYANAMRAGEKPMI